MIATASPNLKLGASTMSKKDNLSSYDRWAASDPVVTAQRARAEADTAAGDASRAAKRAEESAALSRKYPASDVFRERAIDDRQNSENRARYAAKVERDAKAAEAKIARAHNPTATSNPSAAVSIPIPAKFSAEFHRRQTEIGHAVLRSLATDQAPTPREPTSDVNGIWAKARAANERIKNGAAR